ncbi:hypothetical protein [Streptomyces sp. NPDC005969]|uniref:hypothetical protein n=1 Tax=Streptomyces sp. NPDC005969 TaxID=3156722 RepID=UPI0034011120
MALARMEGLDPERLEPYDCQETADGNRGLPAATADNTRGDHWAYWLGGVVTHRVRENIHLRSTAWVCLHLCTKKFDRVTVKDVRTFLDRLHITCRCCAQGLDTERKRCCAIGQCS